MVELFVSYRKEKYSMRSTTCSMTECDGVIVSKLLLLPCLRTETFYGLLQVFVETLDKCFENVCELDLIFHMDKVS